MVIKKKSCGISRDLGFSIGIKNSEGCNTILWGVSWGEALCSLQFPGVKQKT